MRVEPHREPLHQAEITMCRQNFIRKRPFALILPSYPTSPIARDSAQNRDRVNTTTAQKLAKNAGQFSRVTRISKCDRCARFPKPNLAPNARSGANLRRRERQMQCGKPRLSSSTGGHCACRHEKSQGIIDKRRSAVATAPHEQDTVLPAGRGPHQNRSPFTRTPLTQDVVSMP